MGNLFKRKDKKTKSEIPLDSTNDIKTDAISSPLLENSSIDENIEEILPDLNNPNKIIGGIHWYQRNYYLAMKISLILTLCLCVSITFNVSLYLTRPTPVYYAATPDLRLAPLVPLSEPVLTEQGLLNWTTEVLTSAISIDFLHWREKLQSVREHFATDAFESFLASLNSSGMLDLVRDKRLNISAVITQAPVITKSGILEGVASWQIEFPLLASYESSGGVETTQKLVAQVLVSRASTVKTPRGVVLRQVILRRE